MTWMDQHSWKGSCWDWVSNLPTSNNSSISQAATPHPPNAPFPTLWPSRGSKSAFTWMSSTPTPLTSPNNSSPWVTPHPSLPSKFPMSSSPVNPPVTPTPTYHYILACRNSNISSVKVSTSFPQTPPLTISLRHHHRPLRQTTQLPPNPPPLSPPPP